MKDGPISSFDGPLRDALQDRAACNAIRSLHLQTGERSLLTSILSALAPNGEGVRWNGIESITLRHVDASEFFGRYRFPKLWYLDLSAGVTISSWNEVGLHTTALTTLSLAFGNASRVPTIPQLLSILASNPRLQSLSLSMNAIPCDNKDVSTTSVSLYYLKKLRLSGKFHPVFQLLRRLDHPETMDAMTLFPGHGTTEEISGTFGPYVRDYIRRDGRFRGGLGVQVKTLVHSITIQVSTISSFTGPIQKVPFATFTVMHRRDLAISIKKKLYIDLIAHTPGEHVVYFGANLLIDVVRGAVAAMPNLQELHLAGPILALRSLQPNPDGPLAKKLLPSLRRLHMKDAPVHENNWGLIIPYLTHQTSGGQRISLTISSSGGPRHICKDVLEEMKDLVEELVLDLTLDDACPLDRCSASREESDGVIGG